MVEKPNPQIGEKGRLIVIIGPTASGKTSRAVSLAPAFNAEIISADSRQVYRGMDLGTGKDLREYGNVPYHLIDICEAGEKYNLHRYITDFHKVYAEIRSRGLNALMCGGSGMYIENVLSGIRLPDVPANPELRDRLETFSLPQLIEILKGYKILHNSTDIDTAKRAIRAIEIEDFYERNPQLASLTKRSESKPLKCTIIGIDIPRDERRRKISERLKQRLDEGMVEEVRTLLQRGISAEDLIYYGLEYKYLTLYAIGRLTHQEMVDQLEIAIHQFAKRQMTWFRGMEKRGFKINWLPYDLTENDFLTRVKDICLL